MLLQLLLRIAIIITVFLSLGTCQTTAHHDTFTKPTYDCVIQLLTLLHAVIHVNIIGAINF